MRRFQPVQPALAPTEEFTTIIQLWMYRLLIPLGGLRQFIDRDEFSNESLAVFLELEQWLDNDDFESRAVIRDIRQHHQQAENNWDEAFFPTQLRHNTQRLAKLIGLNDTESSLFEFVILLHSEPILEEAINMLGSVSNNRLYHILSTLLAVPLSEIKTALSSRGKLIQSGLINLDTRSNLDIDDKFDLLSDQFAHTMLQSVDDPLSLLRDALLPCSSPVLSISDFHTVQHSLDVLLPYLRRSLDQQQIGVNIYIHGAPGTGKSQLTRVIAQQLDCELFEVSRENSDGDPISGKRRLCALRAGQNILANRRSLMLFDEVEDVLDDGEGFFSRSTAQLHKGWINHMLEENRVPTFWISNSDAGLDPALVRRFDMVFELPIPGRRHREKLLRQLCHELVPSETLTRLATHDHLAPAVVERAARVIDNVKDSLGSEQAPALFENLINNTLKTQGHQELKKHDPARLPDWYDTALLNTDMNLNTLADGLCQQPEGRLCLYGPPGTGKTAFGRWLADQLSRPLLIKRGSDLMSMFVGGTEKKIARAFHEAEADDAVLMIDEVDSFLQDRRGAQRSWEITEVNEMLTQMENYTGVFIASTNLMQGLDQASLRRFDLKLKFDYLHSDQAWKMFTLQCQALNLPVPDDHLHDRLRQLTVLTPGDFAAVARQHRFQPIAGPEALLAALEGECSVKEDHRRPIGFV